MGDNRRRLPGGVLVALAAALLVLGGLWWIRAAPPASAAEVRHAVPLPAVVTVQLDDGRVLTYMRGRASVAYPWNQRRYCRRSPAQYPNMRVLAPESPPVFLTRCG